MSDLPPTGPMAQSLLDALLDLVVDDDSVDSRGPAPERMARVRHEGRPWLFHWVRVPDEALVAVGDRVIFENPSDSAFGTVVEAPHLRFPEGPRGEVPILKVWAAAEVAGHAEKVSKRETEAFTLFRERVRTLRLPMKPVHVEMSALQGRVNFFFWSDARVDFRNLLQDLKRRIPERIDLIQLGSHETVRHIGGIGRCQREVCARVVPTYPPVSPKHARTQGLSPNPAKHMGVCGRLMGCLSYEQEQYAEARKGLPKEGKTVDTPLGRAVIKELDILRARVRVRTEEGVWETFHVSELTRDGKPLGAPSAGAEPGTVDTLDGEGDEDQDFELAGGSVEVAEAPPPARREAPRDQPPREQTARRDQPPRDQTARRDQPPREQTARRDQPPRDQTARQDQPPRDQTARQDQPPREQTARRDQPPRDQSARRDQPPREQTARRDQPPRDQSARRDQPPRDQPPREQPPRDQPPREPVPAPEGQAQSARPRPPQERKPPQTQPRRPQTDAESEGSADDEESDEVEATEGSASEPGADGRPRRKRRRRRGGGGGGGEGSPSRGGSEGGGGAAGGGAAGGGGSPAPG